MHINLSRLKSTFETSSKIGATKNNGLNRLALTQEDKEMRDVFVDWLKNENLNVKIDDVGNIYGRREGKDEDAGSIMIGSHLDTQPMGGRFDGIIGVLAGLEIIRTLNDYNIETKRPIEIVNFTAEEGARYGIPMGGSGVITKNYSKEYIYNLKDSDNVRFEKSLDEINYKGDIKNRASNIYVYLEVHAEQGPVLEDNKKTIGIVKGIKGVTKFNVSLKGKTSHAAHPSFGRKDALVAASEMVLFIDKVKEKFENITTTVGVFTVDPSHVSMITGNVEFSFDIRHINDEIRKNAIDIIKKQLYLISKQRDIELNIKETWNMNGSIFSQEVASLIEKGAISYNYSYEYIVSGAGHDAKFINDIAQKTGMIFTPSEDGLGHCEEEYTSYADIQKATETLLFITKELANE